MSSLRCTKSRDWGFAPRSTLRENSTKSKAESDRQTFRVLFALEGKHDQVLLSLEAFSKKQRKLPREKIELAKRRLRDWRSRSRKAREV